MSEDFVRRPPPGLVAVHAQAVEQLADLIIDWQQRHPLAPLQPDVVLVQSNGVAEWFKMRCAARTGVCAATTVQLGARFAWQIWRQVLTAADVPTSSALDEQPLAWRLMRLLPQLLTQPQSQEVFAPVLHFLGGTAAVEALQTYANAANAPDPGQVIGPFSGRLSAQTLHARLFALAQRLADVFDQYQVYRADWLDDWAAGRDVLSAYASRAAVPIAPDLRWQPVLWRALLADMGDEGALASTRAAVRQAVVQRLHEAAPGSIQGLPARVCVLGLNHVPLSMLEFLAALSRHVQLLLAVPNPCRYHWTDAIDGRELLARTRRHYPQRTDVDLASVPLQDMHAHAHPLLAAWARQTRDYVRLLDAWDESATTAAQWLMPRIDLFDDAPAFEAPTLLQQVQRSIRDMVPLAEHPRTTGGAEIAAADQSIVFHSAHSLARELQVLHDALLHALSQPSVGDIPALAPRDIIVMLPNIAEAAPLIRAIFGQYPSHDARHIPFEIADLPAQDNSAELAVLTQLLHMPAQRWTLPALCDVLDVPAVACKLGLSEADRPQLQQWMRDAGLRWGLHEQHRAALDLHACGAQNTAAFALQRLLLGFAVGASGSKSTDVAFTASDQDAHRAWSWHDIEPFGEVGGLGAASVGALAQLLRILGNWWMLCHTQATPVQWAQRIRTLLTDLFAPTTEAESAAIASAHAAIEQWTHACEQARFEAPVALSAVAAALTQTLSVPQATQRFHAGGVTFCTLMPMRAIPFEMVCLLGMNEGQWPRRTPPNGLDLMLTPGQHRAGDRLRRDHDRQLMLDALLSARRQLYISYSGHSVREHGTQPPSVLVAQLRDYLAAGWRGQGQPEDAHASDLAAAIAASSDNSPLLRQRTHHHLMQPFARAYFEDGSPHRTWAAEWAALHQHAAALAQQPKHDNANTAAAELGTVPTALTPDTSMGPKSLGSAPESICTLDELGSFVRNAAQHFCRNQLGVHLHAPQDALPQDEPISLAGLERYDIIHRIQHRCRAALLQQGLPRNDVHIAAVLDGALAQVQRAGELPLGAAGRQALAQLREPLLKGLQLWVTLSATHAQPLAGGADSNAQRLLWPTAQASAALGGFRLEGWTHGLLQTASSAAAPQAQGDDDSDAAQPMGTWIECQARSVLLNNGNVRPTALVAPWLRQLLAAACGVPAQCWLIGLDGCVQLRPMDHDLACEHLEVLLNAFAAGHSQPVPIPLATAIAWERALKTKHGDLPESLHASIEARNAYEGGFALTGEMQRHPQWKRLFPSFNALTQAGSAQRTQQPDHEAIAESTFATWAQRVAGALLHYCDTHVRVHANFIASE